MIDQFGREVKPGDIIVWVTCKATKYTKHTKTLTKGKVIHIDAQIMWNGNVVEKLIVETDYKLHRNQPAGRILLDPTFIIIDEK